MQFARVAQATDFIYCYTILESNRRFEHSGADVSTRWNPHSVAAKFHDPTLSSAAILPLNRPNSGISDGAELNTFSRLTPTDFLNLPHLSRISTGNGRV